MLNTALSFFVQDQRLVADWEGGKLANQRTSTVSLPAAKSSVELNLQASTQDTEIKNFTSTLPVHENDEIKDL